MVRTSEERDEEEDALLQHVESSDSQALRSLSSRGRDEEIKTFAEDSGLSDHVDAFLRAAVLLDGDATDQSDRLTADEEAALAHEKTRKWNQPWMLYFTILMCSLAAVEQGTAQTSMNGANLYYPKQFGIGSSSSRDTLIVGLINSGIYISVGLIGAWLSEPVNNRIGRRGAIFVGSCICIVANIASSLSQSWQALLLFRVILGAGLGINSSTTGVYAAECSPPYIRGGLAVSWQMFTAFGVFLGFVANIAVYNTAQPWRLQLAFPFIPVVPLAACIFACPESPAWIVKKHRRYDQAFHALQRLRNTDLQAAREVLMMHAQDAKAPRNKHPPSYLKKLTELFTIPRIRRASLASYTVMLSQQLCGINIIAFYSSTIFSDAGFSTFGALMASTIFGFINFLGAFPAVWTMDSLGRRSLLLLTLPVMALTMFIAGLSFLIPTENPAHLGLLATMIYLFCAEYSPGMGPVPVSYSSEVFPLSHRELGMSFAVSAANIWASALSLTFPSLLAVLHPQGAFTLYALLNVLAWVLVFMFVPETKMKTLDELDEVFSIPTGHFIRYQCTEYLPWWTRRYVLRQKSAKLKPDRAQP